MPAAAGAAAGTIAKSASVAAPAASELAEAAFARTPDGDRLGTLNVSLPASLGLHHGASGLTPPAPPRPMALGSRCGTGLARGPPRARGCGARRGRVAGTHHRRGVGPGRTRIRRARAPPPAGARGLRGARASAPARALLLARRRTTPHTALPHAARLDPTARYSRCPARGEPPVATRLPHTGFRLGLHFRV